MAASSGERKILERDKNAKVSYPEESPYVSQDSGSSYLRQLELPHADDCGFVTSVNHVDWRKRLRQIYIAARHLLRAAERQNRWLRLPARGRHQPGR